MLDQLQTQVVSRTDLFGDCSRHLPSSPGPSDDECKTKDALDRLVSRTFTLPVREEIDDRMDEDDPIEEYAFRLFAPNPTGPKTDETTINQAGLYRIQLRSPTPVDPRGDIHSARPLSFYLAAPLTEEQQFQRESVVVDGQTVQSWATQAWPGMRYDWRVSKVVVGKRHLAELVSWNEPKLPSPSAVGLQARGVSHKRPGKKKRIALRKKEQTEREKRERTKLRRKLNKKKRTEKTAVELVEPSPAPIDDNDGPGGEHSGDEATQAEKEKRAARNRLKKLKQREKAKLKKSSSTAAAQD